MQYESESLVQNENFKILRAFTIQWDHMIEVRRPDIVIVDKIKKETMIIDVAITGDFLKNWNSLHAKLDSHYMAWSYKKKKHKKIKAYTKSLYKEPKVNRCLLILDFKPFRL